jgi:polysaccharide biosynthesis transport protein
MPGEELQGYEGYGYGSSIRPDPGAESVLKRYISVVRRHLWPALTLLVILTTLGIIRAYRAQPVYAAVAKILVERQGPRVTKFEEVVQPSIEWWGQEYYKTQEELVQSRAVMEIALEQPGIRELVDVAAPENERPTFRQSVRRTIAAVLGMPAATPPEPWERLRSYAHAKHVNETHFLAVRCESGDPARAAKIANAVARAFVRYHMLRRLEISNDVFLFLQEQKQKEELALQEAEQRLQKFREETHISSLDNSDSENPVLKRLSQLSGELTQKQLDRIGLESEVRVIRQALDRGQAGLRTENDRLFSVPAMRDDKAVAEIRTALVRTEQDRAALADLYGPEHPRMQASDATIATLQTKLKESLANIAASVETQLRMLDEEEAELTKQYNEQNNLALDLAKHALTFSRLANEVDRHQKLYQVLIERMSEVELSSDYTKTNVDLVEEATVPRAPFRPNKQRMALLSFLFGLALSLGLAFFLEQVDDTVRTPEDLELRVGVPVLGFVPEIQVKKGVGSKSSYRALISALEPNSSAIEAYRNIRTSLFFSGPAEESKVLLITSGGPGDGKTTTAANLALVIAQSGKRVLLVDADFRRPRMHKLFGLDSSAGLSSVLVGERSLSQAVQKTVHDIENIENLDILVAGPTPPNPTELLESNHAKQVIAEMRSRYDRVIVDTPPVLFVSDTSILSTLCDGVILVVKSDKRTRAHASRARKQIEKVKGHIIGGILNNVQVSRLGHYYSDYYYHGYARYRSDYYSSYYGTEKSKPAKEPARKNAKV